MLVKYGLFCVNGNINFYHRLCSLEIGVESEFGVQDFYWVTTLLQGRGPGWVEKEVSLCCRSHKTCQLGRFCLGRFWCTFCLSECLDHQHGSPLYHQLAESPSAGFPRKDMTSCRKDLCNWGKPWKSQNLGAVCWSCSLTARQQILPWKSSWAVHLRVCHGLCCFSIWVRSLSVGWTH